MDEDIAKLKVEIQELRRLLRQHLGPRGQMNTSTIPHVEMSAISRGAYTVTNGLTDRTYDADTILVAELADVVATLIDDLKAAGIVG